MPHVSRLIPPAALGAAAVLVAGLVPAVPASAEPAEQIAWQPCYADLTEGLECALVPAPLDYDDPDGEQIDLAMVRLPASDQENKIGSLFVNPGGPGGSAVEFVAAGGPQLQEWIGAEASSRYDLVGIDPRGIGRSSPLDCFATVEDALPATKPGAFPVEDEELPAFEAADRNLAEACAENGGAIAEHMSTANVARDHDHVRELLGEEKLHYYGISYGSQLGSTYANMFPDRVGALVVDAVIDPVKWANRPGRLPFLTAIRSGEGATETLDRFLELCEDAGPQTCALAPDARPRFDALAERVREDPIELSDPSTGEVLVIGYDELLALTMNLLYNAPLFPLLAELLAQLEAGASPEELGRAAQQAQLLDADTARSTLAQSADAPFPEIPDTVNANQGFVGVGCSDSENPSDHEQIDRAGDRSVRTDGPFSQVWTWAGSTCSVWPFTDEDRYTGPYTSQTAAPVLVVGNREDPATRYEGAQALRGLLPNSALLTTETPGHGALGANVCAGELVGQYLLDPNSAGEIDGRVCAMEGNPFTDDPQAAEGPSQLRQLVREQNAPQLSLTRS
ncbi:alpha/beta hydrolase [Desertihabitans aurantiacus]|uniref:alpha/beta hydrolase n=1 Tax=Desertihabitans aurantiacus TaxID=2282477 RepID=UPI00130029F6|nr:alpha/beta hydrolase [Desertihabitans aurantiacus]